MGILDRLVDRVFDRIEARAPQFVQKVGPSSTGIVRTLQDSVMAAIVDGVAPGSEKQVTRPLAEIAAVYACVNAKARSIASVEYKLYRKAAAPGKRQWKNLRDRVITMKAMESTEVSSGPLYDLYRDPAPNLSRFQLWEAIVMTLELTGQWLVLLDPERTSKGIPATLITPLSGTYKPAKDDAGNWVGWWIKVGKQDQFFTFDEVLFDRNFNPYDPILGLSPLSSARLTMETDKSSRLWNRDFFRRDAVPKLTYETDQDLTDDETIRLQQQIVATRVGRSDAPNAVLLANGLHANLIGVNQKDIEFISQANLTVQDICMVYHVPKSIIAVYEDTNYATALAARRAFWENTLIPLMTRIEDKFNAELNEPLGYEGYFDISNVDAISYALLDRVDSGLKLYGMGFTANEINHRLDLGFDDQPWRDEPYAGPQPMNIPGPPAPPQPKKSAQPTQLPQGHIGSGPEVTLAAREAKWKSINGSILPVVGQMKRELRTYFHDAGQKILKAYVKEHWSEAPSLAFHTKEIDERKVDGAFSDERLSDIFVKFITAGTLTGFKTILGSDFNVLPDDVKAQISQRAEMVRTVNDNAREAVKQTIRDTVADALDQGLSERSTSELLVSNLKGKVSELLSHTKTIARTEVHGAYSAGRFQGMKQTGPTAKMWVSSRDSRVRDSHASLDGEKVAFDDQFSNGLAYPLDSAGSAEEVINCRCIMVPLYGNEENI